jgi:hypothetical protein
MRKIFCFLVLLFTFSCAHSIHMVQTNDFDNSKAQATKAKLITARSEQFVPLWFSFDTNYVNQAYSRLEEKCEGGEIKGITTQYSTSLGFLSWTNKILIKGLCYT